MKFSAAARFIASASVGAVAVLFTEPGRAQGLMPTGPNYDRDPVAAINSIENRQRITNALCNSKTPVDALARPVSMRDGDIPLSPGGKVDLHDLKQRHMRDSLHADVAFAYSGQQFTIAARDLIRIQDQYNGYETAKQFKTYITLVDSAEANAYNAPSKNDPLHLPGQLDLSTGMARAVNSEGMRGVIAHEFGHERFKDETTADSAGRLLVGYRTMETTFLQMGAIDRSATDQPDFYFMDCDDGRPGLGERILQMQLDEINECLQQMQASGQEATMSIRPQSIKVKNALTR